MGNNAMVDEPTLGTFLLLFGHIAPIRSVVSSSAI